MNKFRSVKQENKAHFNFGYFFGFITGFSALLLVWCLSAYFDLGTQNFVRGCATLFLMFCIALIFAFALVSRVMKD